MYLNKCKMHVTKLSFIWSHNFRFSMSLSLSPNSLYRQTTDCTQGGGLTREHWTHKEHFFKLHSVSFIYRFDCVFNCTSKKLITKQTSKGQGLSWPWTNGSWIYNYLCNQCQSPLMLWDLISIRARCTTLCDKICQWGPPVSSTKKTDCHNIPEILLKVALNNIKQTIKGALYLPSNSWFYHFSVP
jgi:hypothetical protein